MAKIFYPTGDVIQKNKYESIEVPMTFVQLYDESTRVFLKIKSACSLQLMHWIIANMDKWNQISLNKQARANFISEAFEDASKKYKDQTVRLSITKLIGADAISSMNDGKKREASYFINPSYFWKTGSQQDRKESIKAYYFKQKLKDEGNQF